MPRFRAVLTGALLSFAMLLLVAPSPMRAEAPASPGASTASTTAPAAAPLIPRSVLFGNPERSSPEISPDGTMLAYLAPDQGVLNVWVRTLGKTDDRVITADRKRGIRNLFWRYDSKDIIYAQDQNGDENWRVYQTDLARKQTRDLTPFEKARADIIALEPGDPNTVLIQLNK